MLDRASVDPGRYALAYKVCKEMRWGWGDFCSAPFDFIEEISCRIAYRDHWFEERRKLEEMKSGK